MTILAQNRGIDHLLSKIKALLSAERQTFDTQNREAQMTRASTVCSALALIYLLIGPVLAQVDLSDTDCPNCAPKLLREPEKPQQQKKDDEAVEKGKEQSQKTYEDYTEEEARQKKNQQQR